ncbi:MAG: PQQ-binding-like beta-propeller repeat protein [Planctomycetes bacterium]|nr:PQQ-binding-like beta-propeller repeat protein [Planctomycetota bacterium]
MPMRKTIAWLGTGILLTAVASTAAADWPTYRHDIARTGGTEESLNAPLALQWVHTATHAPQPAWSGPGTRPREGFVLHHRVDFDDAFQVVMAGGRLYFGSSADDKVRALSAATGEEIWSFDTGGPVRLAPTLWNDRVFVGSDDGFVYCLKADTGELVWKVRGGPADERLLGNERMISRWPIRAGVLVDEGTAYFGAGVFPHENVYLVAVRAEDGAVVWRDDALSEADAYQNEFSPQGYLLATATRLFVPSGRALPVGFDKATGRLAFNRKYAWRGEESGGNIGGTYALLMDNQIYTGSEQHLIALDQETGRTGFAWFPGRRLTVAGSMAYLATGKEILALDRTAYAEASQRRNSLEFRSKSLRTQLSAATTAEARAKTQQDIERTTQDLAQHHREKVEPTVKWRVACPHEAELILCGNLVVAGGQDEVCAFERQSGTCVWKAPVEGRARGLAIAEGRLHVSTDQGRIYCFAADPTKDGTTRVVRHSKPPVSDPYPPDKLTPMYRAAAEAIVMETGVTKGYCLVLGAEQGRLSLELARRTELQIIGIEPDPAKVKTARAALDAAGLYGARVVIDQGDPSALPYSNYFANLIVSDSLLLTGKIPGDAAQLARHLKPCGGVICLGVPAGKSGRPAADKLTSWLDNLHLGRSRSSQTNGLWAILKRGTLPGAGRWTHQYANAGNTTCSDDRILSGPLGLLWFGEPGPAPMVNRHDAAAAPLAVNGKLFIQGENVVMAYDSYNATQLWRRDIPGAMRTRLKARECGNLAASDDSFFVALPDQCLRLDAETGKTLATYPLPTRPGDSAAHWGFLAYLDGILYGSAMTRVGVSDRVFAFDSRSGELLWQYEAKNIGNLTLAVGDGWLFFIDSSLTAEQRDQLMQRDRSRVAALTGDKAKQAEAAVKKLDARLAVALDAKTGGKLWETPVDVTDCSNLGGIGGGDLMAIYSDGVLVLCGANANGHYWKQFLAGQFSERRLVALSARTGEKLWARDANYRHRPILIGDMIVAEPWAYDLKTGRQRMRPNPISGIEAPWQFLRPGHHCTALSACPQMILMRSGFTAYYDLHDDSGIRHFAGHRPGCWINTIAADGLVLQPEASAGCICLFPIECSIALEPRPDHDRWGIYSAKGSNTPVRQVAVNLGASGDLRARGTGILPVNHRQDADATTLWLAYPRPRLPADRAAMGFALDLKVEFFPGGEYVSHASLPPTATEVGATHASPVHSSFAQGIKRCTLPLRGEADGPAEYTIRLYFPPTADSGENKATFDIKLQGNVVAKAFDPGQSRQGASLELASIRVERNLEIEFIRADDKTMPTLAGFEAICTSPATGTKTSPVAQQ